MIIFFLNIGRSSRYFISEVLKTEPESYNGWYKLCTMYNTICIKTKNKLKIPGFIVSHILYNVLVTWCHFYFGFDKYMTWIVFPGTPSAVPGLAVWFCEHCAGLRELSLSSQGGTQTHVMHVLFHVRKNCELIIFANKRTFHKYGMLKKYFTNIEYY